ncbi:TPA: hypothetical protein J4358_001731 [Escherichia coli]|nr:hypothetical protein [Escherichia coli]
MKRLVKVAVAAVMAVFAVNANANANNEVSKMCDALYPAYEQAYTMANANFFSIGRHGINWEYFILNEDSRTKKGDAEMIKAHGESFAFVMAAAENKQNDNEFKYFVAGLAIMAAERAVKDHDNNAHDADDGMALDRVRIDFKNMCVKEGANMYKKVIDKHHEYYIGY